jgi:hypothetical protein
MASHIPTSLNDEINRLPFYQRCCYHEHFKDSECSGRIQRHHHAIYAGKQIQAIFCILPICEGIHSKAEYGDVRERLNWIMCNRASELQLSMYSKAIDYLAMKKRLNLVYGVYHEPRI